MYDFFVDLFYYGNKSSSPKKKERNSTSNWNLRCPLKASNNKKQTRIDPVNNVTLSDCNNWKDDKTNSVINHGIVMKDKIIYLHCITLSVVL